MRTIPVTRQESDQLRSYTDSGWELRQEFWEENSSSFTQYINDYCLKYLQNTSILFSLLNFIFIIAVELRLRFFHINNIVRVMSVSSVGRIQRHAIWMRGSSPFWKSHASSRGKKSRHARCVKFYPPLNSHSPKIGKKLHSSNLTHSLAF